MVLSTEWMEERITREFVSVCGSKPCICLAFVFNFIWSVSLTSGVVWCGRSVGRCAERLLNKEEWTVWIVIR